MNWKDDFDNEVNYQRSLAWHRAGLPGGDEYIDWLISRGEICTKPTMDKARESYTQSRLMNDELRKEEIANIRASVSERARAAVAALSKVQDLVTRRRKTLRMADLAAALGIEDWE